MLTDTELRLDLLEGFLHHDRWSTGHLGAKEVVDTTYAPHSRVLNSVEFVIGIYRFWGKGVAILLTLRVGVVL